MEGLGERIKNLRKERGISQPMLAKLIGVSNGVILLWENDINEPKASYIKSLADTLNVSCDYLLGAKDY